MDSFNSCIDESIRVPKLIDISVDLVRQELLRVDLVQVLGQVQIALRGATVVAADVLLERG